MTIDRSSLLDAHRQAIDFLLLAARPAVHGGQPCYWMDFLALGLPGEQWVSAYVAHALAETSSPIGLTQANAAWEWLTASSNKLEAGLAFNSHIAQDADSTVWGCRLAGLLGRSSGDWAAKSFQFLRTCSRSDGGVATYANEADVERSLGVRLCAKGYTVSHTCVSAAAASLPEMQEIGDIFGYLLKTQRAEGFWCGYWWPDREYATALAVESFAAHAQDTEALRRAVKWLSSLSLDASPFRLALRLLAVAKGKRSVECLLRALLADQLEDGSWPGTARVRIPPADLENPELRWDWDSNGSGFGAIIIDSARLFTTATAVRALTACLEQ